MNTPEQNDKHSSPIDNSSCTFGLTNMDADNVCSRARDLIAQTLDGNKEFSKASKMLQSCGGCHNILDIQLKLRQTMTNHLRISAPKNLRIEISANLKKMDLGELDITDFFPTT